MSENRRSIDTKYWTDPDVEDLSKDGTSLFMALLTFPENNMAGTYEISDKKIMSYVKFTKEELSMAISELQAKGKILRHGSWISIKNHIKNQSLNGGMAVSAVKSLCESPNMIKLWLFFKQNSQELEDWFNSFCFTVNKYYDEQRNKKVSIIISAAKKKGETLNKDEVLNNFPEISFTNDQLVKVMTNNLPFKAKELSNYDSMATLFKGLDNIPLALSNDYSDNGNVRVTQQLYNPSMNINKNNELEYELEELNRNNEYEKEDMNNTICAKENYVNHFEEVWKLYPNKKGKERIASSTSKLKEISKISLSDWMILIDRYVTDKPEYQAYMNGSTFFNGGYKDYLEENFEPTPKPKYNVNNKNYDESKWKGEQNFDF